MTEKAQAYWEQLKKEINLDGRPFVDNERIEFPTLEKIEKKNPATNEVLGELTLGDESVVDIAVAAARKAYEKGPWKSLGHEYRAAKLLELAEYVEGSNDELALMDSLEMGKPVREASTIDIPGSAGLFRFYAEAIDKISDAVSITPPGSTATVTREPLGVIGIIVPWNYPLEILTWKLAPALITGNTVVIKPATESAYSALRLAELAEQAGIPAGVINVVPGAGQLVGRAIATHHDVDMVAFTGSTTVAKQLQIYAGESNLKRLALEAGGKSSNIIFGDVEDLDLAAKKAAFAAFYNQGEVCSANSRIFVQSNILDEFLERFKIHSEKFLPGDPLDPTAGSGSMVSEKHADQVWNRIQEAISAGHLLFGGNRPEINGARSFVLPTAVLGVPLEHSLHTEEVFGPLALVNSFESEADVVAAANATPYGLAASIWTGSFSRAHRVASELIAGTVSVNTVDALSFTTPFGGFKQSGFGRDLSVYAIENYTDLKTTWYQWR